MALTRHAAMPDVPTATFSSDNRMLNAVWRLTARSCLYCSHEQFVDTPTREKGQFVWDAANESEGVMRAYGDQNMSWQALARRGPGPGPLLARRAGQRGLPQRRRRAYLRHLHGALPRVALALLHLDRRPRHGRGRSTRRRRRRSTGCGARGRPAPGCSTAWPTPATATPSTATTSSVAADTASNVLAVNAFNRVAQLAALAGDAAAGTDQRRPGRPS